MKISEIDHLRDHPGLTIARFKPAWLYTTKRYPLYWHHIAKNGGTFFKNLLYVLDHDELLQSHFATHDWDKRLIRVTDVSPETIKASDFSLIIIRNPIRRFMSVYFDKVYHGSGPKRPGMSEEFFTTYPVSQEKNMSAARHTENCIKLVEWAEANIQGLTLAKPNWHLVPQMHQLAQVQSLGFRVLTQEDLDWQLRSVLSPLVPDIDQKISLLGKCNKSAKPFRTAEVLTSELKQRLQTIYADDFKVFRQVRQHWRYLKDSNHGL